MTQSKQKALWGECSEMAPVSVALQSPVVLAATCPLWKVGGSGSAFGAGANVEVTHLCTDVTKGAKQQSRLEWVRETEESWQQSSQVSRFQRITELQVLNRKIICCWSEMQKQGKNNDVEIRIKAAEHKGGDLNQITLRSHPTQEDPSMPLSGVWAERGRDSPLFLWVLRPVQDIVFQV